MYYTVHCSTLLYITVLHCSVMCSTTLHITVIHCRTVSVPVCFYNFPSNSDSLSQLLGTTQLILGTCGKLHFVYLYSLS